MLAQRDTSLQLQALCDSPAESTRRALGGIGASNSRSSFTKSTFGLESFGVDTVALAFSGLGGSKLASMVEKVPALRHGQGHLLLDEHPSGARVVWYPKPCTLKVEGRLAALAQADRRVKRLGSRSELRSLPDLAADVVGELVKVKARDLRSESHHLTRLDVTGELRFEDGAEGRSMLRASVGLVPPGYKGQPIYRNDGQVETMYVVTARNGRKVARFYDSGLKHGTARPGELVRYEVQNRWPKASDRTPSELATHPLGLVQLFARHLEPFTTHTREITVTTANEAPGQIAQLIARGELTPRQAVGMAGFAAMLPHGGRHLMQDQSARRYLRLLRQHGIALSPLELEGALTIGEALNALLEGACEVSERE